MIKVAKLLLQAYDQKHIQNLGSLGTFKELTVAEKRAFYVTSRYLVAILEDIKKHLPKYFKKNSLRLGIFRLSIAVEELLAHKQPIYHVSSSLKNDFSSLKISWFLNVAVAYLKKRPPLTEIVADWASSALGQGFFSSLKLRDNFSVHTYFFAHPPLWIRSKIDLKNHISVTNVEFYEKIADWFFYKAQSTTDLGLDELFNKGIISYQDIAPAQLLNVLGYVKKKNISIFDLCAAPGGKSALMSSVYPDSTIIAFDVLSKKVTELENNMKRQGINNVLCKIHDWESNSTEYNNSADLCLVDAPCSGSGVIRKHPDILWSKNNDTIDVLTNKQIKILMNAFDCVKKDGYIIYSTCSIFVSENDLIIEELIKNREIRIIDISLPLGEKTKYGWQIYPSEINDGHYFCLLCKN